MRRSVTQWQVAELVVSSGGVPNRFYTEFGLELMTIDGKIMLHILGTLADHDVPSLAIHDSIVCKARSAAGVEQAMCYNYRKFGF